MDELERLIDRDRPDLSDQALAARQHHPDFAGPDHQVMLAVLRADMLSQMGEHDEARRQLQSVAGIVTKAQSRQQARYQLQRGDTAEARGDEDEARRCFRSVVSVFPAGRAPIDACLRMARLDGADAWSWRLKALDLAQQDARNPEVASIYGSLFLSIGNQLLAADRLDEGVAAIASAIKGSEAADDRVTAARARRDLARHLRLAGQADRAENLLAPLLDELRELEHVAPTLVGEIWLELFEIALTRQDPRSDAWLKEAWRALSASDWMKSTDPEGWRRLVRLAGG